MHLRHGSKGSVSLSITLIGRSSDGRSGKFSPPIEIVIPRRSRVRIPVQAMQLIASFFRILAHQVYDDDPSCFAEGSAASVLDVVESVRLL
jgi:hypothetical protein